MSVQSKALRQIADDVPRYPDYQPLAHDSREIRLLDLGPDFKYTLRHVSLDDKPCYVALSYYRGAPGTTKPIWVNGFEIQLRKTVYQFLKSLFRQFGSITVWLDVICINQRDVQEQGSQVSMMGEIYGTANCVCCWLGAGSADTDYALRRLAVPGSINTPMERRSKKIRTSSEDIGLTVEGAELRHVYAGLEHIFSQPYWARLWIIQEFVLNPTVYIVFGSSTAAWDVLSGFMNTNSLSSSRDFVFDFLESREPLELMKATASETFRIFREAREKLSARDRALFELIVHFGAARCTDPLDKIFGLRSLAADASHVHVDYTTNLFSLVVHLVSHRAQNLFETARGEDSMVSQLASWYYVPPSSAPLATGANERKTDILTLGRTLCYHLAISRNELLDGLEATSDDWLTMDVEACTWFEAKKTFCTNWQSKEHLIRCFLVNEAGTNAQVEESTIDPRGLYCYRTVVSRDDDLPLSICVGVDMNGKCLEAGIALDRDNKDDQILGLQTASTTSLADLELATNSSESHDHPTHEGHIRTSISCPMAKHLGAKLGATSFDMSYPCYYMDLRGIFGTLALRHIWPCRVRDAIHISRFFFAFLLDLDNLHRTVHASGEPTLLKISSWLKLPSWLLDSEGNCKGEGESDAMRCNCDKIVSCEGLKPPVWLEATLADRERRVWLERLIQRDIDWNEFKA